MLEKKIPPSPISIIELVEKIEKEKDIHVIRLDVAEPMFAPPWSAVKGTVDAVLKGKYKYSPSAGIFELRKAISEYLMKTRGLKYSEDEILITVGGKFASFSFFLGLLKPRDSVVLIKPYWSSFKAIPLMLNIKVIEVWSKYPYHLDEEKLKKVMSKKPKAIVINSPNNPTGGILDENDLKLLKDLAEDYNFYVLSDEIDWAYVYNGKIFKSPASLLRDRTIIVDGFSKVFSMSGWRVGFAAGPKELIKNLKIVQEHTVSSPTTFAQYGCLSVLEKYEEYLSIIIKECERKRKIAVEELNKSEKIECPLPEGGFYVYPKIKGYKSTLEFAKMLLEQKAVSVIPGDFFGDYRGHFRISYALSDEELIEGIKRILDFIKK
ncbi:MAG: aminotransferase class I/II-fold pyridoxal phosphate-dependent enzyme [Candidatus Methanomethylicaceae archaeon]|nr:aminotransferase class I/II-fold pyridoxal phosphate-dependent enzyme [Candidatus Verstraetearchaeota archaeon]